MKGLIYRELYLARKQYLFSALILAMFLLLLYLVELSIHCGNLAKLDASTLEGVKSTVYYIGMYFTPILCASFLAEGTVPVADYKSRWRGFSYTLPVSEMQYAAVKFSVKLMFLAIGFGVSLANAAILSAVSDRSLKRNAVRTILLILTVFTWYFIALQTPIAVRFRSDKDLTRFQGMSALVAAVLYFGCGSWLASRMVAVEEASSAREELELSEQMMQIMDPILDTVLDVYEMLLDLAPLLFAFAVLLGFALTVRQLKRRENG